MDNSGTSASPIILVVEQAREMEKMIRSGILSCPNALEFCHGLHDQVIQHIKIDHPSVIIAPLQMDDMTAADLVQEMQTKHGGLIPSIFLTDPDHPDVQNRLMKIGAFDYLPKPFNMQDLLKKVERAIHMGMLSQHQEHAHRSEAYTEYRKLEAESASHGLTVAQMIERKKSTAA